MASRRKAKRASPSRPAEDEPAAGERRARAKPADPPPPLETVVRRTLGWGAGSLILGLAVVGIGFDEVGMVPALVGLVLLVFGIHSFGRLGPEGEEPVGSHLDGADLEAARTAATSAIWGGALLAAVGLAVTFGSAAGRTGAVILAYGAIFAGGFRLLRGLSGLSRLRKG